MIHAIKGPAANTFAEHMTMFCGHVAWRGYGLPEADFRSLQGNHDDCKRCLASLTKRDREFQRKARRTLARTTTPTWQTTNRGRSVSGLTHEQWFSIASVRMRPDFVVRAIAREEGRAL